MYNDTNNCYNCLKMKCVTNDMIRGLTALASKALLFCLLFHIFFLYFFTACTTVMKTQLDSLFFQNICCYCVKCNVQPVGGAAEDQPGAHEWDEEHADAGRCLFQCFQSVFFHRIPDRTKVRISVAEPEPTQVGRSRSRLRDLGYLEPEPPNKVAAPQHWTIFCLVLSNL